MPRKTGTKGPERKFRGFANLVKDIDVEALAAVREKMAEGRRLFFESLAKETKPSDEEDEETNA